jgi:antirestriction protein
MTDRITNSEDQIDSRDVIERIAELMDKHAWEPLDEDEKSELDSLIAFAAKADTVSDWLYGEQFVRDSYFTEHAKELADSIGAVPENAAWPHSYIDWEAAANALQKDYTDFDFDGVTYWARA